MRNEVTTANHYIDFGLGLEDSINFLMLKFGGEVTVSDTNEGRVIAWHDIPLEIVASGDKDGPIRIRAHTSSTKVLRKFMNLAREDIGAEPIAVLRRILLNYTEEANIQELDNFFHLLATAFGSLLLFLNLLIVQFIEVSRTVIPYLILWSFLYAIYRFGMWKQAIDIRLFSISYGLYWFVIPWIIYVIPMLVFVITSGDYLFLGLILFVGIPFSILIGYPFLRGIQIFIRIPQRYCRKRWRLLMSDKMMRLEKRELSLLDEVAGNFAGLGFSAQLSTFTLLLFIFNYSLDEVLFAGLSLNSLLLTICIVFTVFTIWLLKFKTNDNARYLLSAIPESLGVNKAIQAVVEDKISKAIKTHDV